MGEGDRGVAAVEGAMRAHNDCSPLRLASPIPAGTGEETETPPRSLLAYARGYFFVMLNTTPHPALPPLAVVPYSLPPLGVSPAE